MTAIGLLLLGGIGLAGFVSTRGVRAIGSGSRLAGQLPLALATGTVAGCLAGWLALWALDAVGIAWTRPAVLGAWAGVAGLLSLSGAWCRQRRDRRLAERGPRPSLDAPAAGRIPRWAWAGALAAVPLFAASAARLWSLHPDFVYHWGIKGWKFFLARGLDFAYLARPWNVHAHPEYPNLVPGLFAGIAAVAESFDPATMALATTVFFAALLAATGGLFERLEVAPRFAAAGFLAIAWIALAFSVGFRQAGGADLQIALVITLGVVWLTTPLERGGGLGLDAAVAVTASFGAACKVEGIVFGGLLVLAHAVRRSRAADDGLRPRMAALGTALGTALPAAAVVGAWYLQASQHQLLTTQTVGAFDLARLPVVGRALLEALAVRPGAGMLFAVFLLPALLGWRRTRVAATVLLAQMAFYAAVYLSAPADTALLVATSAPRLAFQLLPATWVLLIAGADRATRS